LSDSGCITPMPGNGASALGSVLISKRRMATDSPWRVGLRTLARNRMAVVGLSIVVVWILLAAGAPLISPYDPIAQDIANRLLPPSGEHFFGTDVLGRDVFSRVLFGARISLPTGLIVISIQLVIGSLLGALAAYLGGAFDMLVMRFADVTLAFPPIILAMAITMALGPSLRSAIIAMILVWWPEFARVMRGQVLSIKKAEYVLAAQSVGISPWRVLLRHIIPNAVSPILVKASLDIGLIILFIASLSFVGLGVLPPTPEWGSMIAEGRNQFYHWWGMAFPGLAILTVVMAMNFLGDGVRDALDPRVIER
jgi:peptide/nickel transport system permease protein